MNQFKNHKSFPFYRVWLKSFEEAFACQNHSPVITLVDKVCFTVPAENTLFQGKLHLSR